MAKMDWLVEKLNEDKNYKYRIAETGQNFGTICMPTGYGKSGVIFEDVVKRIRDWKKGDKPLIINISSPILKLTQQTVNDMLQILANVNGVDTSLLHFYICSSDSGDNYSEQLGTLEKNSEDFAKQNVEDFKEICLVAACHKSLWKFIDKFAHFEKAKDTYQIYSYLDEAHKIAILPDVVNRSKEDRILFQYKKAVTTEEYEKLSDEEKELYEETTKKKVLNKCKQYTLIQNKISENTIIDLDLLESFSTSVYAVTATPNSDITDELYATQNGRNRVWGESARRQNHKKVYTVFVPATQAIRENIICPPLIKIVPSKAESITPDLLENLMQNAINENPNIKHKVLVTLRTIEEVKEIRGKLEKLGNRVFSTDSKEGFREEGISSIQDFIKEVQEFEGNCFVLHIRQLIEGIDISGLTDCVIFTNAENHDLNQQDYKRYVQTIGRTLRLGGERGDSKDKRLKKSANVYFVTKNENQVGQFRTFINSYYGYGNVHFFEVHPGNREGSGDGGKEEVFTGAGFDFGKALDLETPAIEKLWMSTKEELDKIKEIILKLPNKSYVFERIFGLCMAHQAGMNGVFDTEDYLYNTEIQKYLFEKVGDYLEDINGNPKGWREFCEKRGKYNE